MPGHGVAARRLPFVPFAPAGAPRGSGRCEAPVRCVGRRRRRGNVVTHHVAVRGPRSVGGTDLIGYLVTVPFVAVALLVAVSALPLPAHVDEVTIDNPHDWPAHVRVTDADRDGWLGVGTVGR